MKVQDRQTSYLMGLLRGEQAVVTGGHFVYTSGAHGDGYANLRFLGESRFGDELRRHSLLLLNRVLGLHGVHSFRPILVVGPETLGAMMVKVAVEELNYTQDKCIRFAKLRALRQEDGTKTFEWADDNPSLDDFDNSTQVVFMDDLLNAGSTLKRARRAIRHLADNVVVAAFLFNRSDLTAKNLEVCSVVSLITCPMRRFEDGCPLCRDEVPIVRSPGHGAQFEIDCPNYPGGFVDL